MQALESLISMVVVKSPGTKCSSLHCVKEQSAQGALSCHVLKAHDGRVTRRSGVHQHNERVSSEGKQRTRAEVCVQNADTDNDGVILHRDDLYTVLKLCGLQLNLTSVSCTKSASRKS